MSSQQAYDTTAWPDWGLQLLEEMKGIKLSVQSIESKMNSIQQAADNAVQKVNGLGQVVQDLTRENQKLKDRVLALELYSRKNNLILLNVKESKKEKTADLYQKIGQEFSKVGLNLDDYPLDNLHRLPKPDESTRPKPVIIKFVSHLDKELVWDSRFDFKKKGSNLFIKEHIPAEVEAKVRQLEPIRRAAKAQGMKAKISGECLVINSQAYRVETLHQLPSSLHPQNIAVRQIDDFVFFYSKETCLSNFHPANFNHKGLLFSSSEQYLHYEKAKLFGGENSAKKILECDNPGRCKKYGHSINGFSEERWQEAAYDIMLEGLQQKFQQNPEMATFLKSTESKRLVEAAPGDLFWGIGKGLYDKRLLQNPDEWGQNLMGKALEAVRENLE